MARVSIDDYRALPNHASLYRWKFLLLSAPLIGAAGFPLSETLDIRCESAELPKATNQKITVNMKGHQTHNYGITIYGGSLPITFQETEDNVISLFLQSWKELIWATRSGVSQSKSNVEATIMLQRLNSLDEAIWYYTLHGCFIEDEEKGGTLSADASDILRPVATLSYDFYTEGPVL